MKNFMKMRTKKKWFASLLIVELVLFNLPLASIFATATEDTLFLCTDTLDNDLDGLIDAADPDCAAFQNHTPVANNQAVSTNEDTALLVTLTATDTDPVFLSYVITSDPVYGTISGAAPNLTYTPDANYNGTDSFTFKANDGTTDSGTATVDITVTPVNDAPTIELVGLSMVSVTVGDTYVEQGVATNDVDGDVLTSTTIGNVDTNTIGTYVLNYEVIDGALSASTTRTVNVTAIPPVDVCPNIEGTQTSVPEGKQITDGRCVDLLGGNVSVHLATDTPSSSTLVSGQALADLAHFTFTNPTAEPIKITNLTFNSIGVSNDATLASVYLYDGIKRLAYPASVSSGKITWNDSSGIFMIPANGTFTLAIKANIQQGTSGQFVGVSLASTVSDSATITGAYPISGNMHTLATVTMATVNFGAAVVPTTQSVDIQTDFLMWQNVVNVGMHAVKLSSITFRQMGSVGVNDLRNFRLYLDGLQVGAPISSMDADGYLILDLSSSPLLIQTGTHVIQLVGDIVGGGTKYFSFSVQDAADVVFIDNQLGVAVPPTVQSSTFTPLTTGAITVNGTLPDTITNAGRLSITKDADAPSGNVVNGATDTFLAKFTLTAFDEPIKVENLRVAVQETGATPYSYALRSGALFANGVQVGSTMDVNEVSSFNLPYTQFNLGGGLIVYPGTPVTLEVRADVFNTGYEMIEPNDTLMVKIVAGSSNMKRTQTLGYFSNSAVSANTLTIAAGDTTPPAANHQPIIFLYGTNPMHVSLGSIFIDPAMAAVDQEDGDITSQIVKTGTVDTSIAGTYTRRYNVTDSGGLSAAENMRTVIVDPTVVIGNNPSVLLASDTPPSSVLVSGQALADLAHFTFNNPTAEPVKITNLTFNRIGISNDTALANVYLYDGIKRLTYPTPVSSGKVTWNDSSGIFTIPANGSITVAVKADIAAGVSGQLVGVSLASAVSDSATITGTYPISGNIHTLATVTMATVNFGAAVIPTTQSVDIQTDFLMWQNVVNVGTRAVNLSSITFRQMGSVGVTDLANFRLFLDGNQIGTPVSSMDADGYLTFDLSSSPLLIQTGTHTIRLVGDIVGGATKTFSFSLEDAADANFIDSQLGASVLPMQQFNSSFSSLRSGTITVNGTPIDPPAFAGTLTIAKDANSPSGNVVNGANNALLAKFTLTATEEPIKVESLRMAVQETGAAPYSYALRSGALFANGVQVGSTMDINEASNNFPYTQFNLGGGLIVYPGTPVVLEVRADVFNTGYEMIESNDTLMVKIVAGSSNMKRTQTLNYFSNTAVQANTLTVAVGNLSGSKNAAYVDQTTVAPQNAYKLGDFTISSNDVEPFTLNELFVSFGGTGNALVPRDISNVYIKYGTKTTGLKNPIGGWIFYPISETIAPNTVVPVEVWGSLNSSLSVGDTITTALAVAGIANVSQTAWTTGALVGQTTTISSGTLPQCSDGIDNDGDGNIDTADATCHTNGNSGDTSSYNPYLDTENSPPVITILGDNPTTLVVDDTFVDPGATAHDTENGDIPITSVDIMRPDGTRDTSVDTSKSATYMLTYMTNDLQGYVVRANRSVNVISDAHLSVSPLPPGNEFTGGKTAEITVKVEYPGAHVSGNIGVRIPKNMVTSISDITSNEFSISDDGTYYRLVREQNELYSNSNTLWGRFQITPLNPGPYGLIWSSIKVVAGISLVIGTELQNLPTMEANLDVSVKGVSTLLKAPTITSVQDIGGSSIKVNWADNSPGVTNRFVISRSVDGGTYAYVDDLNATFFSFTDTNAIPGKQHCYIVRSMTMPGGQQAASAPVCATASAVLQPVTLASVTAENNGDITVNWSDAAGSIADGYRVMRQINSEPYTQVAQLTRGTFSYRDNNTSSEQTHCYFIRSYINTGGQADSTSACATALSTKFLSGDRVKVVSMGVAVNEIPNGISIGTAYVDSTGTIIGGPVYSVGYWWWKVDYDTGADGWSQENWLEKNSSSGGGGTVNQPPVITIIGANPLHLALGAPFYPNEYALKSDPDGDSVTMTWDNPVNTAVADTYQVVYTATDIHGAQSSETLTVIVNAAPESVAKFLANDRIIVFDGPVNVRNLAGLIGTNVLGTQATGNHGTVVGGPIVKDGYTWWNINYDTGADGWSAEDFLEKDTAETPPPTTNHAPVAADVSISTTRNTPLPITFLTDDIDIPAQTLTYSIVSSPAHGTLGTISGNQITYTPASEYTGTDSFTFKANDGTADSNVATVNVTVNGNQCLAGYTGTYPDCVASPISTSPVIFSDDFNDDVIDTAKWTSSGAVVEENGMMDVNASGKLLSGWIPVNGIQPITVSRKDTQNYGSGSYVGMFRLLFDTNGDGVADFGFGVDHANSSASGAIGLTPRYGIFLISQSLSLGVLSSSLGAGRTESTVTSVSFNEMSIWNVPLTESLTYDPVSGVLSYSLNGVLQKTLNVGPLLFTPRGYSMQLGVQGWSFGSGYYDHFDDISVMQAGERITYIPPTFTFDKLPPEYSTGNKGINRTKGVANKDLFTFKTIYSDVNKNPQPKIDVVVNNTVDFNTDAYKEYMLLDANTNTIDDSNTLIPWWGLQKGTTFLGSGSSTSGGNFNWVPITEGESVTAALHRTIYQATTTVVVGVSKFPVDVASADIVVEAFGASNIPIGSREKHIDLIDGKTISADIPVNATTPILALRITAKNTINTGVLIQKFDFTEKQAMTTDTETETFSALKDGDFANGEQYTMSSVFSKGNHSYYFEAADTKGVTARYPTDGNLSFTAGYDNVMFLPGIMGSKLYDGNTGEQIWLSENDEEADKLKMDEGGKSVNDLVTKDVIREGGVDQATSNVYKSFLAEMKDWETQYGITATTTPYDWRLDYPDVVNGGRKFGSGSISYLSSLHPLVEKPYLEKTLRELAASSMTGKVTIIGHSQGGLIAKQLAVQMGNATTSALVGKMIFVASPQLGTPKAVLSLLHGGTPFSLTHILCNDDNTCITNAISDSKARELAQNMPSAYNLLPSDKYFEYNYDQSTSGDENRISDPIVKFDPVKFKTWIDCYGEKINSPDSLKKYMTDSGTLGSLFCRLEPTLTDDLYIPEIVSPTLYQNAINMHNTLDNWKPPSGVDLVTIAGWGMDTLSGLDYTRDCGLFICHIALTPRHVVDGDGTVVDPSALWLNGSSGKRYWVDLPKYNKENIGEAPLGREHADILEVSQLRNLLRNVLVDKPNVLTDSEGQQIDYVFDHRPPYKENDLRIHFTLHSPLTLEYTDTNGKHVGPSGSNPDKIDMQIPGANYERYGEVQWLSIPADVAGSLTLNGTASGTFTLDVEQASGNTITATTSFMGIPTTDDTVVTMNFADGTIANASPLTVDENGDGTTDVSLEPVAGEVVPYDSVAPQTTATVVGTLGMNDWHTTDVSISLAATDDRSGVMETKYSLDTGEWQAYSSTSPIEISSDGIHALQYYSVDWFGNTEATSTLTVKIDKTTPVIVGTLTPEVTADGWYKDDVSVHFTCTDAISGVLTVSDDVILSNEGANQSASGACTDMAGNSSSTTVSGINIDKTLPTITATRTPANLNGWNNIDVTVHYTCSDELSGVMSCPFDDVLTNEGSEQRVAGNVTDMAGNSASITVSNINIDKTKPIAVITTPANGGEYTLHQNVSADWSASDALSGLLSATGTTASGALIDTGTAGEKTYTVTATDNGGNVTVKTVTYYVRYDYGGILQPINGNGTSIFKFGSTVPVKFQLKDANGNFITSAIAKIYLSKLSDGVYGTEFEAYSTSAASTGNQFRYDADSNRYVFNLNTKTLSVGTWQIRIALDDGSSKTVNISLK